MASKGREGNWVALDIGFFGSGSMLALIDQFGVAGPPVFIRIVLNAKKRALGNLPVAEQGIAKISYSNIARSVGLKRDVDLVRAIVAVCVEEELLEVLPGSNDRELVARLLKWEEWEPKDSAGAERQRRYRAKHKDEPDEPDELEQLDG